ncbi:MAG: hypothetical protein WAW92_02620 [Minisyncoccia bacterium]
MKKIGFDLDDVLLNLSDPLREFLNIKYTRSVKREDLKDFYIESIYGIEREIFKKDIADFYLHNDHINSSPINGAVEVVEQLSKKYILEIVTAKPDSLAEITEQWLLKHFPNMFKVVHFANHHHDNHKKRLKSEICLVENISVFIDDSLDNAKDLSSSNIPVLLFDAPWNQSESLPGLVKRVHSWNEIEKEIENLL